MINLISNLKDFCVLAKNGKDLANKIFLSGTQKELLRAAAQIGEFHILNADTIAYPIIRAGGIDMGDENDPSSLAKYHEGFVQLCKLGYIEHSGGQVFRLTAFGFEKARSLE